MRQRQARRNSRRLPNLSCSDYWGACEPVRDRSSRVVKTICRIETHSAEATENLGRALAGVLDNGDLVVLKGPLGSGKTTLVKGVAQGLGCPPASSPTFVLVKEYQGRLRLRHADFFRLETTAEVEDLGLEDIVGTDAVTVVEWPEPLVPAIEDGYLEIAVDFGSTPSTRAFEVSIRGAAFESRRDEIARALESAL
jgi:tRNA threonylcarbamoyladenosine biosynthesis protein TsaE